MKKYVFVLSILFLGSIPASAFQPTKTYQAGSATYRLDNKTLKVQGQFGASNPGMLKTKKVGADLLEVMWHTHPQKLCYIMTISSFVHARKPAASQIEKGINCQ